MPNCQIGSGDFHMDLQESEHRRELSYYEIRNTYVSRTEDYDLRLEISGKGATMDEATVDLEGKMAAFNGKKTTKARAPSIGVKPRPLPF